MSTTYAIFRKGLEVKSVDGYADTQQLDKGIDFVEIGRTRNFVDGFMVLVEYMPEGTPVYATDNGTRLQTLGELKEYYSTWKSPCNTEEA